MQSSCPYTQASYATWRLHVLRRLCAGANVPEHTQLPFLFTNTHAKCRKYVRDFHTSKAHARKHIKDLKRTAKYKLVHLELEKYVKHGVDSTTQGGEDTATSRPSQKADWNPYSENSLGQLQDLVADLRVIAKEAARKTGDGEEADNIPFELGSTMYSRKNSKELESPLERKLPWDREKKLQVHEVNVDKRLQNNIWAQMLASPLRLDRATKARVPKDLMIGYGVMKNPKDEKDYLLPVELSDLEILREELQRTVSASEKNDLKGKEQEASSVRLQPRRGTRVQLQPSKLLIKAMTEEFNYVKKSGENRTPIVSTNSAKVSGILLPFRWRYKQAEMDAFQRTRRSFNEVLGHQPDADEPDMTERARLDKLQWQSDAAERLEKILNERVLIALKALSQDNASGRAIHDRRVLAVAVPGSGNFYSDERGRIALGAESKAAGNTVEGGGTEEGHVLMADWMYGAVCLYVGTPKQFCETTRQWERSTDAFTDTDMSSLGQSSSQQFIPPMITINEATNLPVFNLDSLLGADHTDRLANIFAETKILSMDFWQKENATQSTSRSATDFKDDVEPANPSSLLDAGAQVLSSIVTPRVASALSSPEPASEPQPTSSTLSSTSSKSNASQEPFLIVIKPQAKHSSILISEIWQLWRYMGGRKSYGSASDDTRHVFRKVF